MITTTVTMATIMAAVTAHAHLGTRETASAKLLLPTLTRGTRSDWLSSLDNFLGSTTKDA
jgi:hypothetical protein